MRPEFAPSTHRKDFDHASAATTDPDASTSCSARSISAAAVWAYSTVAGSRAPVASTTANTRTVAVSTGNVTATVSATGTVASAHTVNAAFVTSGTVTEIDVRVGDKVAAGQVLAKVDPADRPGVVEHRPGQPHRGPGRLTRAKTATTPDAATIASAQAQVTSAQATVDADQRAADGCVLTAPMAGTVTAVNGERRRLLGRSGRPAADRPATGRVAPGRPLATSSGTSSGVHGIADLTTLQVDANFAEADATKLKVGQPAAVTWAALSAATATGKVASIAPTATTSNNVNSYAGRGRAWTRYRPGSGSDRR